MEGENNYITDDFGFMTNSDWSGGVEWWKICELLVTCYKIKVH